MNETKPKISDQQSSFTDTPDQVFDQMLSTSFPSEEKLARFLNGKDKMESIRCYTNLLNRLFYLKTENKYNGIIICRSVKRRIYGPVVYRSI